MRMKTLTSKIIKIAESSADTIAAMFDLYHHYYAGTNLSVFTHDLQNKNWVILLYDEALQLRGFSTLALFTTQHAGETVRVLYSGDTVVDHQFWGQHELAAAWIRFAGEIKNEQAMVPLYWLLIVKGHRTYRYLSAFCHTYFPAPDAAVPEATQSLMDQLARERFGDAYDVSRGVISFSESHGHLRDIWSDIPDNVKERSEVRYFLQRNPHYERGEELVCLCELTQTNLKPYARRIFISGVEKTKRACA
jgi:hypothetical protein